MADGGEGNQLKESEIARVEEEEEEAEWEVEGEEEDEAKVSLGMAGRVWTERNINAPALIDMMRRIWNPRYGMEANCIGKNMFFFQFHHWMDKDRVMEAQPWHFDRHVIILSNVTGEQKPSDIPLFQVPFWVRIYDLPFKGRNTENNAKMLGNKVGTFIKVDTSDVVGINKSMRVRVLIDVRKPLQQEVEVRMKGGTKETFKVTYEKLPLFCYVCGKLGHGEKDCHTILENPDAKLLFSDKIRASPWKANKVADTNVGSKTTFGGRNLFVTKPSSKSAAVPEQVVVDVVRQLEEVSLSKNSPNAKAVITADFEGQRKESTFRDREENALKPPSGESSVIEEVGLTLAEQLVNLKDQGLAAQVKRPVNPGTDRTSNKPKIGMKFTLSRNRDGKGVKDGRIKEKEAVERSEKRKRIDAMVIDAQEDETGGTEKKGRRGWGSQKIYQVLQGTVISK